jgi:hypothetical protein
MRPGRPLGVATPLGAGAGGGGVLKERRARNNCCQLLARIFS